MWGGGLGGREPIPCLTGSTEFLTHTRKGRPRDHLKWINGKLLGRIVKCTFFHFNIIQRAMSTYATENVIMFNKRVSIYLSPTFSPNTRK